MLQATWVAHQNGSYSDCCGSGPTGAGSCLTWIQMARRQWLIIHLTSGVAGMKISSHMVICKDIIQQETGGNVSPTPKRTGFSSLHRTGKRKRYKELEHWLNMSSFNVIPGSDRIFHKSFLSVYEKLRGFLHACSFQYTCLGETWQRGLFQFVL